MEKLIIKGKSQLKGEIKVSGAKNVAMKVILAGLLTDKPIFIKNVPQISSVFGTINIVKPLGVKVEVRQDHSLKIKGDGGGNFSIPLELGGLYRTATMVMGPLLAKYGRAVVPNPGGCRLGKRPIDRHINGLKAMGAKITYHDGFFDAKADSLHGVRYRFEANTHTGTECMILAAVLAKGETVLENAAEEPEIDNLTELLTKMGAKIKRLKRTIIISGVRKLYGTEYNIMSDRNEVITFAVGAIASGGDIVINGAQTEYIKSFLEKLDAIGAGWEKLTPTQTRFYAKLHLKPINIITGPYPGFMTDWQAPMALILTQAHGSSTIHETVYEDRFGYVKELIKMGATIKFYNPTVFNPKKYYNFHWSHKSADKYQAIRISGPTKLHNAVLEVADLRAGATILLAAIIAEGDSIIHGVEHIDRGYEKIETRLKNLGVKIKRESN